MNIVPTIFEFAIRTAASLLTPRLTLPSRPPCMRAASPTLVHCAVARTCVRRLAHPAVTRPIPSRHLDHHAAVSLTSPSPLSHGRARRAALLVVPSPLASPTLLLHERASTCTHRDHRVCVHMRARSLPTLHACDVLPHPPSTISAGMPVRRLPPNATTTTPSIHTRRRRHLAIASSLHT